MSSKEEFTKIILAEKPDIHLTFEQALKTWWMNIRKDGGFRLTDPGDIAFRSADFEFFDFDFMLKNSNVTLSWNQYILELNKKLPCPYYINVKSTEAKKMPFIRIYDSRVAMLINLYGSVDRYIQLSKERKR